MNRLLLLLSTAILVFASCAQPARGEGSLAIGRTMRELASASDLIVVGTVMLPAGTRNLARLVSDTTQEAKDIIVLGQDYNIRVESALKGMEAPGSLLVVSLAKWHGVPGQAAGTDDGFVPFTIGARYVLFLRPLRDGSAAYGQGLEPFRFRVDGAVVRPESRWADASNYFPDQSPESLFAEIRSASK